MINLCPGLREITRSVAFKAETREVAGKPRCVSHQRNQEPHGFRFPLPLILRNTFPPVQSGCVQISSALQGLVARMVAEFSGGGILLARHFWDASHLRSPDIRCLCDIFRPH